MLPCYPRRPIGGFRVAYEYANRLVARGHEVAVVHPRRFASATPLLATSFYQRLRRQGARLRDVLFPPHVHWQPIDKQVRMLYVADLDASQVPDGDAVFATSWPTVEHVAGYPACKGKKFYLVQDFDPWLGPRERLQATWRLPFQKVTVSRWLYKQVVDAEGGPENVVNIPNGIDHERFHLTADMGQRPKQLVMFFRRESYKAPEDGALALEIAKRGHPGMSAAVLGQAYRKPPRVPPWASYLRRVSDDQLIAIYNSSSIFVGSSLAEGFALPPAEAMACGCAVVSTDCGGIREFAEPEVTALLSPPGDPEALARNILRLLDDDALRQRLAAAGHERIQSFTWERSTDQLEVFMRKQVGRG